MRMLLPAAACMCMALASSAGAADWSVCPGWRDPASQHDFWSFSSPFTHHWSEENASDHKTAYALSLNRQLSDDRFCGFSLFRNSFGQPSAYAYTGWSWPQPWRAYPKVYVNVTTGIIYGYVGEFKDKVPLNVGGFSPVVIPSVGYHLTPQLGVEVHILGTAAVMIGANWHF